MKGGYLIMPEKGRREKMYREDFKKVSEIGKAKTGWLKENPIGYFVAAMVAAYFTATAAAKSALDAGAMFVR